MPHDPAETRSHVETPTDPSLLNEAKLVAKQMAEMAQKMLDRVHVEPAFVVVGRDEYEHLKATVVDLEGQVSMLKSVADIHLNSIEILHSRLELIGLFAPGSTTRSGAPFKSAETILAAAHYYCAAFLGRTLPPKPDEGAWLAEYQRKVEAAYPATTAAGSPSEALEAFDDVPVPALSDFDLSDKDGRLGFLSALFHFHYRHGLLMAVNHVWSSLARPKAVRCQIMAQALKLSGTGKAALKNVLAAFLQETLYGVDFRPLPDLGAYPDSAAWNAACTQHFDGINAQFDAIYHRYEAILDGRKPDGGQPSASVVKGPWVRQPAKRAPTVTGGIT